MHFALAATQPLPTIPAPKTLRFPERSRRVVQLRLRDPRELRRCLVGANDGFFVLMPDAPEVGALVDCVLLPPGGQAEHRLTARVIRRGPSLAGPGAFLALDPLSCEQRSSLARLLRRVTVEWPLEQAG